MKGVYSLLILPKRGVLLEFGEIDPWQSCGSVMLATFGVLNED